MTVLIAQLCPTLCDLMDCGPPGSSVHGILHARILEENSGAIPYSKGSSRPRNQTWVSPTAGRFLTIWATRETTSSYLLISPQSHSEDDSADMDTRNFSLILCTQNSQKMSIWYVQFSSVQLLSHVRLFATPWTAAHQASLSITNSRSPPKPMSIESVIPSNHFISLSPSPPALNLSQHQGLFQWVSSSHQVAKVLESQL